MSIINRTRKRLFSFSKGSGGQDPLNEEVEPRTLDDSSLRRFSNVSNRSGGGGGGGGGGFGSGSLEEKRKPTSYVFLQIDNPQRSWKVVEDFAGVAESSVGDGDERYESEKVYYSEARDTTVSCRIVSKFSDDAFDDYLYEIGLLNVKYPRFDDLMGECELLKELSHPNVIKFVDVYYYDAKLLIMTEYCPSGSIEELIDDLDKPLTLSQVQYVARDVLLGLEYLNEKQRVLHRDLKCANLLIGKDMSIKIANFEVSAKNQNAKSPKLININDKRYLYVKSPHYMAPEILKCDPYAINNFKSDIWSFGITCIEMAEMLPPNSHMNPEAIIDQVKFSGWQGPKLSNLESWPGDFSDLITKCLNVKYDERPAASELLKHQFFRKSAPSKEEFEQLLTERKSLAYSHLKERFEKIGTTIEKLGSVRSQPREYVKSYFNDLRALIDAKAEEAKQRIENERLKLHAGLKSHEDRCVKEAEEIDRAQGASVDKLNNRFKTEFENWKSSFSSEVVNENAVHKTKAQLKNLKKQSDAKLNELKMTVFKNKSYVFQARVKDSSRFGDIVIDDANPETSASSIMSSSGGPRVRRSSSVVAYQVDDDDEFSLNAANRPPTRFIRIEIKPVIKKRYSIY